MIVLYYSLFSRAKLRFFQIYCYRKQPLFVIFTLILDTNQSAEG